jgi:hypothetical protein
MDETGDIELAEDTKKKAVCGKCSHFGGPHHHNFGMCMADDDVPLHGLYRSHCPKYEPLKKKMRVQGEMRI